MVTSGSQVGREPAVPCHGNLWIPRWEPSVPTFRKRKFFAMVTHGSQVGTQEFQPLGTGSSLQWQPVVPTLATVSSNLCQPAVPCHEPNANIPVPAHEEKQSVLYRSIKQNHKIVKKMFSYHFDMHLLRAKTFLCRPNRQTQTFHYRSIKQNKGFPYRLSKQNKTTLRTMIFTFLESTDPSTGNVTFSGLEP